MRVVFDSDADRLQALWALSKTYVCPDFIGLVKDKDCEACCGRDKTWCLRCWTEALDRVGVAVKDNEIWKIRPKPDGKEKNSGLIQ